jgi:hypothetical protein
VSERDCLVFTEKYLKSFKLQKQKLSLGKKSVKN